MAKIYNAKSFITYFLEMGLTRQEIASHTGLSLQRVFAFLKDGETPTFEEAEKLYTLKYYNKNY